MNICRAGSRNQPIKFLLRGGVSKASVILRNEIIRSLANDSAEALDITGAEHTHSTGTELISATDDTVCQEKLTERTNTRR